MFTVDHIVSINYLALPKIPCKQGYSKPGRVVQEHIGCLPEAGHRTDLSLECEMIEHPKTELTFTALYLEPYMAKSVHLISPKTCSYIKSYLIRYMVLVSDK